jgi:DNA-binding transcriptional regulator GbsR (MarR family)
MKFSTTINHAGIASIQMQAKTDLVDWCLLDYIANFESFEKAKKLNGKVWINFKHLISEMPMLGLNSKSSVSNRIKKLRGLGLLETSQDLTDQKLYAQTSELYKTAANFCAYTVLQEKPPVQTEKQTVPESEHKAVNNDYLINNLKETITTTASEENLEIRALTAEEQECFDWAIMHTYWATACISIDAFLKAYTNQKGGLVSQYDAHKKAREKTWTVNGLNSEKSFKSTGGNYNKTYGSRKPNRDFSNPPKYFLPPDYLAEDNSNAIDSFVVPAFSLGAN